MNQKKRPLSVRQKQLDIPRYYCRTGDTQAWIDMQILISTSEASNDWLQKEKGELDHDAKKDKLKKKIDRHQDRVLTMRKSNLKFNQTK